jgi:two-component system sensor histidine kinase KdpD
MKATHSMKTGWRYTLSAIAAMLAPVALAQLFPRLEQTNIALLYLLAVLISATNFGLGPAILSSALAFLSFNFFFVPPLHTLTVSDPQDILRLFTFLFVAVIASSLAGHAHEQADTAERRAAELAALYGLSQAISAEVDLERILPVAAETAAQLLGVPHCAVLLYDGGRLVERASYGQPATRPAKHADAFLRAGPRVLGVLRVTQRSLAEPLTSAEQEQQKTIAAQLVLVLERARLAEAAGQAHALAESDRLKSALLSSVSHDLRTPLAVIKGAATNLLQEDVGWEAAARREFLITINQETDHLNRLVGNLLDMSRIEAGALNPARSWQDLGELIGEIAERLRPRLDGHPLELDLPDDLPPVQISYTQIDQVLTNLVENAAKYTPPGTPIGVRAQSVDAEVQVEILDSGPGIPDTMISHIFDKFFRTVEPERHADGTGLGLAICKGIVEAHGGRIWVENRPSGGARFIFTLPLSSAVISNSIREQTL